VVCWGATGRQVKVPVFTTYGEEVCEIAKDGSIGRRFSSCRIGAIRTLAYSGSNATRTTEFFNSILRFRNDEPAAACLKPLRARTSLSPQFRPTTHVRCQIRSARDEFCKWVILLLLGLDPDHMSKVVLITGSSTGFGRATAEAMARRGYNVFATMRDSAGRNTSYREALESLAKRENLSLRVVEMDVASDESVSSATQAVLKSAGRIDVVVNNAGVATLGITEAYSIPKIQRLFEVNVFGAARVNRAVLPAMRRQRSGLLIHVSSAAGRVVVPYLGIYCASKFALEALADSYRFELAPYGIDSVVVEPGIHRTPILENFQPPDDEGRAAEYGPQAEYVGRVKAVFDNANAAKETPGSEEVAEAFIRLVEMPVGTRPFRTVPTPGMQPLLESHNLAADQLRQTAAQVFNVRELLTLKS
jgi:NAD(P)-dependent dehydrogenase (short-subunit alcohol dehydrogenase family)